MRLVQQALEQIFERRNKPGAFRVDNGEPFGSPSTDTAPPLSLWLIAHDIDVIWNKPRCPQMNGVVEHLQDTSCRWAEIYQCGSHEELQQRLDQEAFVQRQHFPVTRLQNKTRLEAFPDLEKSDRVWEPRSFCPSRVYQFLSQRTFNRKVSTNGQIQHAGQRIGGLAKFKHLYVQLKFNNKDLHWEIYHDYKPVKRIDAANHLSPERLLNLSVYQ